MIHTILFRNWQIWNLGCRRPNVPTRTLRLLPKPSGDGEGVHAHVVPPSWLNAMDVIGRKDVPLSNWSPQKMIEDMDKGGVATSILSPTTPQVTPLGKDTAARVSRESNEYSKKLEADHPGRFGTFAMLPLPNIDDSLKEIAYAFDTLKVDGVGVMTSYRDKWLGHPDFAPVWEELKTVDDLGALVVFARKRRHLDRVFGDKRGAHDAPLPNRFVQVD